MKPPRLLTRLMGPASLLLALLLAGIPAASTPARAASRAQISPMAVAVAEAVSPATGHLFALSRTMDGPQAGQSWVTMLDARSGKVLRATPVAAGAQTLAVDDGTQHVFVLSNGDQQVASVFDARTGAQLATVDLGKGAPVLWSLQVASRLGLLFLVTNPDPAHLDKTPNTLRVFDTKTGRPVRTLQLPAGKPALAVYEGSGRLYVACVTTSTSAAVVRLYDLKQWTLLKTIPSPAISPFTYTPVWAVDETHGLLVMLRGTQGDRLSLLDAATGVLRREFPLPATLNGSNLGLDEQAQRAFVIGGGDYHMDTGAGKDGTVRTVDLTTGALLRRAPVGAVAYPAVVDPRTHQLFVLSGARADSTGHIALVSSLVSMLDTRTGALLRATKLPLTDMLDLATIAVDSRAGFVYVNGTGLPIPQETAAGHNPNSIAMLDTQSGALVRTVVLPQLAQAAPVPAGQDLTAVAASAAHDVWAVGGGGNDPHGKILIEHWDGARWQVAPAPVVEGRLNGVAAISARDAWAVGVCTTCTSSALIMHWDGSRWQVVPSPVAGGTLHGVAARSAHDVWAVGDTPSTSQPNMVQALVLHWDGTGWKVVPSSGASLWGVAASSGRDVWAVGYTLTAGEDKPQQLTLTEHWDGRQWRVVPSPSTAVAENGLFTVAAISGRDVWAAGWAQSETATRALMLHWDGARWRVAPVPTSGMESGVMGLAASSARDVWGAGGTIMQHWDGTRWSVVPIAGTATAPDALLLGVAAVSSRDVWAVGRVEVTASETRALIAHWDGARWSVVPG